jgi:hypothetical protein
VKLIFCHQKWTKEALLFINGNFKRVKLIEKIKVHGKMVLAQMSVGQM